MVIFINSLWVKPYRILTIIYRLLKDDHYGKFNEENLLVKVHRICLKAQNQSKSIDLA